MKFRKYLCNLLFAVLLMGINALGEKKPMNVIYMIGDGMGVAQISLARIEKGSPLNMDSMTDSGFLTTYSANSMITDSAAAGTALAAGRKTNNGMIGVLPDGTSIPSILEVAAGLGKATGLVTTVTITHATPASFGAHQASRSDEGDIAPQYLAKKVDVLLGGGRAFFLSRSLPVSKRTDDRDLIAEAKALGYSVVDSRESMMGVTQGKILGLFKVSSLSTEPPEPTLAEMSDKSIELLSRKKEGFFLMIEEGQIDYRGHANDTAGVIKQTLDFDAAIGRVLQFARKTKNTLVIVTADHETGGLTLIAPDKGSPDKIKAAWSTKGHSGTNVALFAEGPGSSLFRGLQDNADVPRKIARLWNDSTLGLTSAR